MEFYGSIFNFSDNCECRRPRFNTTGDGVQDICAETLSSPCNCTINSCGVGESYNDVTDTVCVPKTCRGIKMSTLLLHEGLHESNTRTVVI